MFINAIQEIFSHAFMVRALITGLFISVTAAVVGVSLVLKRYSMIGDGLSHVGFGALAVSIALGFAPLAVAVPVVIIAAFFLLRLSNSAKLKGDAAIALISTASLAIGVLAVSLSGTNADLNSYLFGSIIAVSKPDMYLSVALSVIVGAIYVVLYNRIFSVTFDEEFTTATGANTGAYNMLIAISTAITVVLGMRVMGALLISSLIIFPCLTAMRVFKTYKGVMLCSCVLAAFTFFAGLVASFMLKTPTGATIVLVNLVAYLVFYAVGKLRAGVLR